MTPTASAAFALEFDPPLVAEADPELATTALTSTLDVVALARTEEGRAGMAPYLEWQRAHPGVRLASLPESGAHGDVIVNATAGISSLSALEAVGADALAGKIIVDVALPLDGQPGQPRSLVGANTGSLGEQIQRAFPWHA